MKKITAKQVEAMVSAELLRRAKLLAYETWEDQGGRLDLLCTEGMIVDLILCMAGTTQFPAWLFKYDLRPPKNSDEVLEIEDVATGKRWFARTGVLDGNLHWEGYRVASFNSDEKLERRVEWDIAGDNTYVSEGFRARIWPKYPIPALDANKHLFDHM